MDDETVNNVKNVIIKFICFETEVSYISIHKHFPLLIKPKPVRVGIILLNFI